LNSAVGNLNEPLD